jgi:hypothetical protein
MMALRAQMKMGTTLGVDKVDAPADSPVDMALEVERESSVVLASR